jgi:hypothetical protein
VLVGQIGFNPWSAIKQVEHTAVRVASDPRAQRAAATAANAYYPEQYAQVRQKVGQARQILRQNDGQYQQAMEQRAHQPPMPQFGPMPPQFDPDSGGPTAPVQHGNIIGLAAVAGAGLVLFLLLRK